MEFIQSLIDLFLHLDKHLDAIITSFGFWTYLILFLVIFCETGLIVTPFLPGDSLLFAVGTFAARGSFEIELIFPLLVIAAIVGDNTNYWIGRRVGPRIFSREDTRLFNKRHLVKTHNFYEKHGTKAIIIARFLPIVRTFTPFVAGIGAMRYRRFVTFDIAGGLLWVGIFVLGGYFFGNLAIVQEHFSFVVVAIVMVSALPAGIEFLRHRLKRSAAKSESPA